MYKEGLYIWRSRWWQCLRGFVYVISIDTTFLYVTPLLSLAQDWDKAHGFTITSCRHYFFSHVFWWHNIRSTRSIRGRLLAAACLHQLLGWSQPLQAVITASNSSLPMVAASNDSQPMDRVIVKLYSTVMTINDSTRKMSEYWSIVRNLFSLLCSLQITSWCRIPDFKMGKIFLYGFIVNCE